MRFAHDLDTVVVSHVYIWIRESNLMKRIFAPILVHAFLSLTALSPLMIRPEFVSCQAFGDGVQLEGGRSLMMSA